jgi:probable phosphoglycerate mutase
MRTELILIRHGETVWNAQDRFQGQQDSPLTPLGLAQATAVAAHLRSHLPDLLYASDLGRTLQTATPIAIATGLELHPEPGLREINLGVLEGLTGEEARARYPEQLAAYFARKPDFVVDRGESLNQLTTRLLTTVERLVAQHPGKRIAAVSHGASITALLRHLLGIPPETPSRMTIRNGSLSWLSYGGDYQAWRVLSMGEVAHLSAISLEEPPETSPVVSAG